MSREFDLRYGEPRWLRHHHPLLRGKPIIGRGVYGAVFDNGKTVLKLTACDKSAMLLTDPVIGPKGRHFPKLIEDHGVIGCDRGPISDTPLHLLEIEKLAPVPRGGPLRALVRKILEALPVHRASTYDHRAPIWQNEREQLFQMSRVDKRLPISIRSALRELGNFIHHSEALLDLHAQNFMVRGGTLVLNDPVYPG